MPPNINQWDEWFRKVWEIWLLKLPQGGIVLNFLTGTTGGIVIKLILGCNGKTTVSQFCQDLQTLCIGGTEIDINGLALIGRNINYYYTSLSFFLYKNMTVVLPDMFI
jgi:hypothetical protein